MSERVRIDRRGDVAYLALTHASKHNALDWEMLSALVDAAETLKRDRALRGVILHAEGPSFCSGLDFPKFTKEPARMARAFAKVGLRSTNLFQEACWAYRRLPVPVLAVTHGRCFGGGLQLALGQVRALVPGCVIPTDEMADASVRILANGVEIGRGELVEVAGRLAVEVTQLRSPS